jgi:hypothetical protein
MVTVFRFESWDVKTDQFIRSSRWATRQRIESLPARIVGDGVEVPDEVLGREIDGMTDRNFDPHRTTPGEFQRVVRSSPST